MTKEQRQMHSLLQSIATLAVESEDMTLGSDDLTSNLDDIQDDIERAIKLNNQVMEENEK